MRKFVDDHAVVDVEDDGRGLEESVLLGELQGTRKNSSRELLCCETARRGGGFGGIKTARPKRISNFLRHITGVQYPNLLFPFASSAVAIFSWPSSIFMVDIRLGTAGTFAGQAH